MKNLIGLIFLFLTVVSNSQCIDNNRYKCWSKVDPIALDDFQIGDIDDAFQPIQGQFGISYEIKKINALKKNFNNNVSNLFLKNLSEIDTAKVKDLKSGLAFIQLQFDLSEIHVRKFRKQLYVNRKKLIKELGFVEGIQEETIENFTAEKQKLIDETKNGTNQEVLKQWKAKIEKQLEELFQFSSWNNKKIKI